MPQDIPIHLASGSVVRADLLRNAGVVATAGPVDVDEEASKELAKREGKSPSQVAEVLAAAKALAADRGGYVIGADQVLDLDGALFSKPRDKEEALNHLLELRGRAHHLHSAVCVARDREVVFHNVYSVRLVMRDFSDQYLHESVDRNWPEISYAVGAYMLEAEGSRLFREIEGDYFTVLGLPLLSLLNFFADEGVISA